MSTSLTKKRSLIELHDSNTENGAFIEPPAKKQKLAEEETQHDIGTNSNQSDDINKMEIDEIKPFKKENKAFILFSGSVSNSTIDSFCAKVIKQNQFEIISRKNIETTRDKLEKILLDGISSTIDIGDIIEIGMFDEFVTAKSLTVILVSYDTDNIYQQLNTLTQTYFVQYIHQFYVTLNYMDYLVKYKSLFVDNDNELNMFRNVNINENETECLYELMETDQESDTVKCCCIPITMFSKPNYTTKYGEYIKRYGLNQMAKQCYQRAIERGCCYMNVATGPLIMETIWGYLGVVVHCKIDKYKVANYECYHCSKCLYLKQNERKHSVQINKKSKKKSSAAGARKCEICNVEVPSSEKNWEQHINGKKHKKKLQAKQNK